MKEREKRNSTGLTIIKEKEDMEEQMETEKMNITRNKVD